MDSRFNNTPISDSVRDRMRVSAKTADYCWKTDENDPGKHVTGSEILFCTLFCISPVRQARRRRRYPVVEGNFVRTTEN